MNELIYHLISNSLSGQVFGPFNMFQNSLSPFHFYFALKYYFRHLLIYLWFLFLFNLLWSSGRSWRAIFPLLHLMVFIYLSFPFKFWESFAYFYSNHWFKVLQYWFHPWLCSNNIWILPLHVLCSYSLNLLNFVFISPCLLTRSLLILFLTSYFISSFIENTKEILSIYLCFW